ncbi:MAG: DapH/DapD/GlmU-related protein [bacterium]|nr:DapH/DapD/GlmU-related protein [bacterium]
MVFFPKLENESEGKVLGSEPKVAAGARISACELGRYTEVAEQAMLEESSLDDYSYVMERCDIIFADIGKFANIASEVRINPSNHPMDWVSQHHFLYRRRMYGLHIEDHAAFFNWRRRQRVHIGHDTWLGHGAIIMPGVRVGNGAAVGAGAIVTHDVPPYAIVVGAPAKVLRYRFPEAIRRAIEATGWYHWDHETLKERLHDFYDLRLFLERYAPAP